MRYQTSFLFLLAFLFCLLSLIGCSNRTGTPGSDGLNGLPGANCTVSQVSNGAIITCPDGTTALVQNGSSSEPSAFTIVDLIDPCGQEADFDEVLLKLYNGQYLVHFSHGGKQFLSTIGTGSYVTTDGTNCHFTINQDGTVNW